MKGLDQPGAVGFQGGFGFGARVSGRVDERRCKLVRCGHCPLRAIRTLSVFFCFCFFEFFLWRGITLLLGWWGAVEIKSSIPSLLFVFVILFVFFPFLLVGSEEAFFDIGPQRVRSVELWKAKKEGRKEGEGRRRRSIERAATTW